jgi:hypothetical protein
MNINLKLSTDTNNQYATTNLEVEKTKNKKREKIQTKGKQTQRGITELFTQNDLSSKKEKITKNIKHFHKKNVKRIKSVVEKLYKNYKKIKFIIKGINPAKDFILQEAHQPLNDFRQTSFINSFSSSIDISTAAKVMLANSAESTSSSKVNEENNLVIEKFSIEGEKNEDNLIKSEDNLYVMDQNQKVEPSLSSSEEFISTNVLINKYKAKTLSLPIPYESSPATSKEKSKVSINEPKFPIGENKLLKGKKSAHQKFKEHYLIHYLNQAAALEFLNKEGVDEETKQRLKLIAIQGMDKAAKISETEGEFYGKQMSPFTMQATPLYHRSLENEFLHSIDSIYAKRMEVGNQTCVFVIANPQQMRESLGREALFIPIDSIENFEGLATQLLSQGDPDDEWWIDFTALLQSKSDPVELKKIIDRITEILKIQLEAQFKSNPNKLNDLIQMLLNCHPVAFVNYQHEQIMLILTMKSVLNYAQTLGPLEADLKDKINNFSLQHNTWQMLSRTGGLLTMDRAKEAFLKVVTDVARARTNLKGLELSTYATEQATKTEKDRVKEHPVCENFSRFLNQPEIKKFRELSNVNNAPPFLKIMPETTVTLLQQLEKLGIDEAFEKRGLTELLQMYYFGMLTTMHDAICQFPKDEKQNFASFSPNQFIAFNNDIDALHQGIQNILAIVQPYSDQALADAVVENLTIIPIDLPKPLVAPKRSAMHNMSSIMASVENQKRVEQGHDKMNTLILTDSYYESVGAFEHAKQKHTLSVLKGDEFNSNPKEAILKLKAELEGKKIDFYVCEFEHNISLTRQSYQVEKITEHVNSLFEEDLVGDKLTVAIDTTLELENSSLVYQFLTDPNIKKRIQEGKLNVILTRSAQKFDMLGLDNYSGGIATIINNGQSFEQFNQRMMDPNDQLKGLSYQGLAHTLTNGKALDRYRKALMDNTLRLYQKLPKEAIYHPETSNPMQISALNTDKPVFLDIKFPNHPKTAWAFASALYRFTRNNNILLTQRPSFGFANSNFTIINNQKFRLNPGLEDEQTLNQYAQFFQDIQNILQKSSSDAFLEKKIDKLYPEKIDN